MLRPSDSPTTTTMKRSPSCVTEPAGPGKCATLFGSAISLRVPSSVMRTPGSVLTIHTGTQTGVAFGSGVGYGYHPTSISQPSDCDRVTNPPFSSLNSSNPGPSLTSRPPGTLTVRSSISTGSFISYPDSGTILSAA